MSSATSLRPPSRTMISAERLEGSTNCSCIGLTVARYWVTTESRLRPRSLTSREIRRSSRTSASVSTKILMSIISRSVLFWKIRIPFLLFNILYLIAQFVAHIGGWDDPTQSYYGKMNYIGMYFAAPPDGKPTNSQRNLSVAWQLVVIFLGVINAKPYTRHVPPAKFENLVTTRIYNAICSTLHHWLPIIIQISLNFGYT